MLEQGLLRLLPWRWSQPGEVAGLNEAAWTRKIAGAEDRDLGFVQWVRGPFWASLGPERLEVRETEDAALLMSLEHGWLALGQWKVMDAEPAQVGTMVGAHLLDEHRFRFATFWHEKEGGRSICSPGGQKYAHIERTADGIDLLRFDDQMAANPFLRMVLLGATILQSARPINRKT
jgi:hypothetical protein